MRVPSSKIFNRFSKTANKEDINDSIKKEDVTFAHAVMDKKGQLLELSPELLAITGHRQSSLKMASIGKIITHSSAINVRGLLNTMSHMHPFASTEVSLITSDKETLTMELVLNLYISNNEEHLFCIFRNVDHDRRLMAELNTLKEHYQLLADHSSYVQILLDHELKSLYISPSCKNLSGYSSKDAITRNLFTLIHPDDFEIFWDKLTNHDSAEGEIFRFRFKHHEGHFVHVECQLHIKPDQFGQPEFFILNLHDITRQKKYEQELIKAQNEAETAHHMKNNFLASITHELRTPLNAIIGFSRILEHHAENSECHRFTQYIESSGMHLLGLIDNLLEYARIENNQVTYQSEEVGLEQFFRNLFPKVRSDLKKFNKDNLELIGEWDLDESAPVIWTNRTILQNIFVNLIDNAIKFTPQGFVHYGCRPYGIRQYLFFVEDSGIGIPNDAREMIFEKFTQLDQSLSREYGGTGLGLTVTKKFVEILGGDIWVISEKGKGSSFYFSLPVGYAIDKTENGSDI
jgi:PAS domain S-box-containing protein